MCVFAIQLPRIHTTLKIGAANTEGGPTDLMT